MGTGTQSSSNIISGAKTEITNVVAKTKTRNLDVDEVYLLLSCKCCVVWKLPRFGAVCFTMSRATVTMFGTGTVTLNGFRKPEDLPYIMTDLVYLLIELKLRFDAPVIVNIVAKFQTGQPRNLVELYLRNQSRCFLNPEVTNSLELRLGGSLRVLLHSTGKGIITGARSKGEISDAFNNAVNLVYWS